MMSAGEGCFLCVELALCDNTNGSQQSSSRFGTTVSTPRLWLHPQSLHCFLHISLSISLMLKQS